MNEEDSQEFKEILQDLVYALREIRELLKPKQKVVYIEKTFNPYHIESLRKFKESVLSDEFYKTLSDEQKQKLTFCIGGKE